jgi:phenylpropionate dioxygenase-like ring-hydroxylating dioxygenase large terminal subunit
MINSAHTVFPSLAGWDMFMENVLDPAHVVVSHHNIIGNRSVVNFCACLTRI